MEQNEVQKIKFFLKNHPGLLGPFPNESKLQTKIVCKREASGICPGNLFIKVLDFRKIWTTNYCRTSNIYQTI